MREVEISGTPLAPWGPFFRFFQDFFENRGRGLARLLQLYRVFILTKKEDINTPKLLGTTSGPLKGCFLWGFELFLKVLKFSETLDMSSKQLREMFEVFGIGPSVLRATSGLAEQLRQAIILGIFPLVVFSYPPCFYPRRDCRRILNFCMGC